MRAESFVSRESLHLVERAIAVPQLLYPEPTAIKWHFSQENAILHDAGKGM
jgi:hypothetical protein